MIVTRQTRRRKLAGRFLWPAVVLAVLAIALLWPPAHRVIADGPLKPMWGVVGNAGATVAGPMNVAAARQRIGDRERTIRDLNAELDRQRQARSDADGQVRRLREQVSELSGQPRPTPAPRLRPAPVSAVGAASGSGPNLPSAEEKRLAATWSAMDPDRAAAVVQRLPLDEVIRVLAAMDPDSAGAIMDALPVATAARISRAVAQVATTTGR